VTPAEKRFGWFASVGGGLENCITARDQVIERMNGFVVYELGEDRSISVSD